MANTYREKNTRTWSVKRSRSQHFTDEEKEYIRKCYRAKEKPYYVASQLQCSVRAIHKHYADLRNGTYA